MAKHTKKTLRADGMFDAATGTFTQPRKGVNPQGRQGDVLVEFQRVRVPADARKMQPVEGRIILAEGEVTGHHHAISVADKTGMECYEKNGQLFLHFDEPGTLVHEEHDHFDVAESTEECTPISTIQLTYSPLKIRKVRD